MFYHLFETALGEMGLAWTATGVARLLLPGSDRAAMRARFAKLGAVVAERPEADGLIGRIRAYTEGGRDAFSDVPVDLEGVPEFHRAAYAEIRRLGWGETTTYGAVARRLGDPRLARAVGQAMGANPVPLIVPCHRVLAAAGRSGGFSAPGGVSSKMRMLALERASTPEGQFGFGF